MFFKVKKNLLEGSNRLIGMENSEKKKLVSLKLRRFLFSTATDLLTKFVRLSNKIGHSPEIIGFSILGAGCSKYLGFDHPSNPG